MLLCVISCTRAQLPPWPCTSWLLTSRFALHRCTSIVSPLPDSQLGPLCGVAAVPQSPGRARMFLVFCPLLAPLFPFSGWQQGPKWRWLSHGSACFWPPPTFRPLHPSVRLGALAVHLHATAALQLCTHSGGSGPTSWVVEVLAACSRMGSVAGPQTGCGPGSKEDLSQGVWVWKTVMLLR